MVPLLPGGFHRARAVGLSSCQVFRLARIVRQVIKLRRCYLDQVRLRRRRGRIGYGRRQWIRRVVRNVVEPDDELPISLANGPLWTETPVECVVWSCGVFAFEV